MLVSKYSKSRKQEENSEKIKAKKVKSLKLVDLYSIHKNEERNLMKTLLEIGAFPIFILMVMGFNSCSQGIKTEKRNDNFTKIGLEVINQNISNGLFNDGSFPKNEFKLYFNEYETEYFPNWEDGLSGKCEIIITINHNNTNDIRFQSKRKYDFVNTSEILKCDKPWTYDAQYGGWDAEFRNSKGYIVSATMDGMSNIDLYNKHKDSYQSLMLYFFASVLKSELKEVSTKVNLTLREDLAIEQNHIAVLELIDRYADIRTSMECLYYQQGW